MTPREFAQSVIINKSKVKWQNDGIITFQGPDRYFSNYHECPVFFEGIKYPTNEHAFAAAKTLSVPQRYDISELKSPGVAKQFGRRVNLRSDWERVKTSVMAELVASKFEPGSKIAQKLLDTGSKQIVEGNVWNDTIWGAICDTSVYGNCLFGENRLGQILMNWRTVLQQGGTKNE